MALYRVMWAEGRTPIWKAGESAAVDAVTRQLPIGGDYVVGEWSEPNKVGTATREIFETGLAAKLRRPVATITRFRS